MALSLYVMPITVSGPNQKGIISRTPKYRSIYSPPFLSQLIEYGAEPWCLVGVVDIDSPTDAALTANADVQKIPPSGGNLDAVLTTGQRNAVQNNLEASNIPGTWVTTSNTWRDVVLFFAACCQFATVYQGITVGTRWFGGSVTLDTTFGSLGAGVRQNIQAAATQLATANKITLDQSGLTGASTLRQIIQSVAQQCVTAQISLILAGVSLYQA